MFDLQGVSCGYATDPILQALNFSLHPGELTVLLGKNGSGKSTLLKTLSRLLLPLEGNLVLDGKNQRLFQKKEWAKCVAYHDQHHDIPDMDTKTLLAHSRYPYQGFIRELSRDDQAAIDRAVEHMQIEEILNKPLGQLSGGYLQRVYLALTLARETGYILFDEPDAHLDVNQQHLVYKLLTDLAKQGHGVFASLHDLSSALKIADRILLLDQGRLEFDGSAEQAIDCGILQSIFQINIVCCTTDFGPQYLILPR